MCVVNIRFVKSVASICHLPFVFCCSVLLGTKESSQQRAKENVVELYQVARQQLLMFRPGKFGVFGFEFMRSRFKSLSKPCAYLVANFQRRPYRKTC